jgi:hypothetical protein
MNATEVDVGRSWGQSGAYRFAGVRPLRLGSGNRLR